MITTKFLNFFLQNDVCRIGGLCYAAGFVDIANVSQVCVPGKSKITWSILTNTDIIVRRYTFIQIIVNLLITKSYNFTLSGNPKFTNGPTGGKALQLNGIDDFVDLGDQTAGCLGDPEKCKFGLSVKFNLKVLELKEKMYIFSSGGDSPGKYGMSMWYSRKRLYLTVSTRTKIWTVYVPFKKYLNTFVNIEYSWSIQGGLSLYFDGIRVARTVEFYRRTTAVLSRLFYLGRRIETGGFCRMIIDGWDLAEGTKEMTKDLDVVVQSPEIKTRPDVDIEDRNGTSSVFVCKFDKLEEDGLSYSVYWAINDQSIKRKSLAANQFEDELLDRDIQQLNFKDEVRFQHIYYTPCFKFLLNILRYQFIFH